MVRVGGLQLHLRPEREDGHAHHATCASTASRSTPARSTRSPAGRRCRRRRETAGGEPIWDVVARYLRDRKLIKPLQLELPRLKGMQGNAGIA